MRPIAEVSCLSSDRIATKRLIAAGVAAVVAAFTAVVPAAAAGAHAKAPAEHVGQGATAATIVRNSYGVPSVYSPTMTGMWFGAGWAQAQDRLVQLELTQPGGRGHAVGRSSARRS